MEMIWYQGNTLNDITLRPLENIYVLEKSSSFRDFKGFESLMHYIKIAP